MNNSQVITQTQDQKLFDQFIEYKALSCKFDDSAFLVDQLLANSPEAEKEFQVKNICAKLNIPLVNRLEATLKTLVVSKRMFIEMAIISALDRADEIIASVNVTELVKEKAVNESVQTSEVA